MNSKTVSYIGLAQRAGKVVYGEDKITEQKHLSVVLVDNSASDDYKQRIINKIKCAPVYTVDGLKAAVHREQVLSIGVLNDELGKAIIEQLR